MTKILLVEDDKSLREIYGVRLLAEGYDIVSAGDGEEALAMAIKERPTLIISDVMMPKISGFDMLDILRSTTETRSIKVIMMTALSSEEQRQRGVSLGADKYLVKSQVGIEDVVRVVHEVLDDRPTASASGDLTMPNYNLTSKAPEAPAPVSAPAPASAPLPSPTEAFETPRPAGAGERIIQPLAGSERAAQPVDINALLDKELASEASANTVPQFGVAPAPDAAPVVLPDLQQPGATVPPLPQAGVSGVSSSTDGSIPPPPPAGPAPQA